MKIGVISDTHGNITAFRKALELFEGVDMIIHAGDVLYHPPRLGCGDRYDIPAFAETLNGLAIPVVIAQGNCDPQVYEELLEMPVQSPYAYVSRENLSIVVNHGHLLLREKMIELGRRYRADYFISGHTHVPVLEDVGGLVLMNPGSPAISKYEVDGRLVPTVGLITDTGARIIDAGTGAVVFEIMRQS
jgi:putative phosphoesterase